MDDSQWMNLALSLAHTAYHQGEVPVGAVLVRNNSLLATGFNQRETRHDPAGHAEMIAIRKGAALLGSWRLSDCKLYVTLEPCIMCAGVIFQSRIREVIFATRDPKGGACGSLYNIHQDGRLNHRFLIKEGVERAAAATLLSQFFSAKR